ncbi:glycerophosphodiester phosphodiesterase, partial [Streptomyces lasiicapitis]
SPAGPPRRACAGGPGGAAVGAANTTGHHAFALQAGGVTRTLERGRHTLRLSLDADAFQNWNLDYLQLEPVTAPGE